MLKRNLFFLFAISVVAIASTILCIFNYSPYEAAIHQMIFFYLSIYFALGGIISIAIFYFRISLVKKEIIFTYFWPSVRQSAFISAAITALLVLKGLKLFDLWVAIPTVIIILLLELFFQTKKRPA